MAQDDKKRDKDADHRGRPEPDDAANADNPPLPKTPPVEPPAGGGTIEGGE